MKRALPIAVSLAILAAIYWRIDFARLGPVFAGCHGGWLALALGMVLPLTALTAWRFARLGGLPFGEATRLTLSACVLNLVLPSKAGDIVKALFIPGMARPQALALVVYEKACDLLALLACCACGLAWVLAGGAALPYAAPSLAAVSLALLAGLALLLSPAAARLLPEKMHDFREGWLAVQRHLAARPALAAQLVGGSLLLWLLHLVQVWLFILALRAWCPFSASLALAPLAILAGLLPLTFAGAGTRDFALIALFSPYFPAPTAAALGLLCTARYLLPALGGLPFFRGHLKRMTNDE